MAADKQHAHRLIDNLAPSQIPAAIGMLESLLDPVARAIANAPVDDEPVTEEELCELEEARASIARGEGIPHEEILAEFGLTLEDFARMGRTPLKPNGSGQ
jgi:hypothetical protein